MIDVSHHRWLLDVSRPVLPILLAGVIAVLGALVYLELVAILVATVG